MRRIRETCSGKTRYASQKEARTMANHLTTGRRQQRHHRPNFLRTYPCDQCRGWHLTHKEEA